MLVWAPEDTPEWLRVHRDRENEPAEFYIEVDVAVGDELPEELTVKGWGKVPQNLWDSLLERISGKWGAINSYFAVFQANADNPPGSPNAATVHHWDTRAFGYIHVRHKGDAVWWTDLDHGPVEPVTLYDLVVFIRQPRVVDGRRLWMLTLSQFDNAEWPPESQGGPPYTPHVSVGREAAEDIAEDRTDGPWPPVDSDEHGVLHMLIEMPKGPPRWLAPPSTLEQSHFVGGYGVPVRIDMLTWEEILRADGYAAAHPMTVMGETPATAVVRQAQWLLEVLEGGRRTEGEGALAPNAVYIDAARYFEPRVRFAKYGRAPGLSKKHGIWAGAGFYKKETIRELLQAVIVEHQGSTVWLFDLEAGKPNRVLTLWELIGHWFGDIGGKQVGARQIHAGFGPVSIYFVDMREPGTARMRGPEKKLWPMSEAQWESGEWPSVDVGGPPAERYGMEPIAHEAHEAREAPVTDNEFPHAEPFVVFAPPNTPEWLKVNPSASIFSSGGVEVVTTDEQPPNWPKLLSSPASGKPYDFVVPWSSFVARLRDDHGTAMWRYDMRTLAPLDAKISRVGLAAIEVRWYGSPVWWVDLDDGPVQAATLFDLVIRKQPWKVKGRKLWLMSLHQWDNAEWPAESQGGPPYTPHVSVAREKHGG